MGENPTQEYIMAIAARMKEQQHNAVLRARIEAVEAMTRAAARGRILQFPVPQGSAMLIINVPEEMIRLQRLAAANATQAQKQIQKN